MKICVMCLIEKEDTEFHKKKVNLQSKCKECNKLYLKEHYRLNKQSYLDRNVKNGTERKLFFFNWLATQQCKDCGISDIRVLQFDHLRDKKFNIAHKIGSLSWETLQVELEKCEIVCANCHSIRTADRGNWYSYLQGNFENSPLRRMLQNLIFACGSYNRK